MKPLKKAGIFDINFFSNSDTTTEGYYKLFLNSTIEGIVIHIDEIIIEVNDSFAQMFGYSRDELKGVDISEIVPINYQADNNEFNLLMNADTVFQAAGVTKDKKEIFVEVSGRDFYINNQRLRITSVRNITDNIMHNLALKQSEEKFKNLIAALPDILLVVDYNDNVLFVNDQLTIHTGMDTEDLTFGKSNNLVFEEDLQIFNSKISSIKKSKAKTIGAFQIRFVDRADEILWFSITAMRTYYEGSPAIQLFCRNITDSKKTEIELKRHKNQLTDLVEERTLEINKLNFELLNSNNKLQKLNDEISEQNVELKVVLAKLKNTQRQLVDAEKLASVGKLTAGLSHELNNPINWIGGVIRPIQLNLDEIKSSLSDNIELNELFNETEDLFNSIKDGTQKIANLVKTLSDIAPKGNLSSVERVFIEELVKGQIDRLESRFPSINYQLEIPSEIEIVSNVLDLQHVFFNLIKNSAEAVSRNENLAAGEGFVKISVKKHGAAIKALIEDNGGGIDSKIIKDIYEPFYTTRLDGANLGLGLYIVKSIISKYEGNILLNNSSEKGTTISFLLPEADIKAETEASALEQ